MRSGTRIAALSVFAAFLITGCRHRQPKVVVPPQAAAPSLPPSEMARLIPPLPPIAPPSGSRPVMLDTSPPPRTYRELHPRPIRRYDRYRRKTAQDLAAEKAAKAAQQTAQLDQEMASAPPTGASPIGQLSTAGGDANAADRGAIADQINATENALNSLHRRLSPKEEKTVAQIRSFITRARDALKTNDLDGARTLSTKAHLLLQELLRQ